MLRVLGSVVPHGFDTHVDMEYVTQERFVESGWSAAQSTSPVDEGATAYSQGEWPTELIGEGLPDLQAGKTYHYRLVATSTAPGDPIVDGSEQTLTVPVPGPTGEPQCPNEALRTGLAAGLPDCRAYELVTPADK
jgi:hypothetical protein